MFVNGCGDIAGGMWPRLSDCLARTVRLSHRDRVTVLARQSLKTPYIEFATSRCLFCYLPMACGTTGDFSF